MALRPITTAPAPEPLDPQRAVRLTEFARSCGAATRAVSLYPAGHPTVNAAVTRIIETARNVTAGEPFLVTVLPHGLLLDGRAPVKPDPAVAELARLLHHHRISGLILRDGGDATTWHTLLGLLGRPPDEIREAGGIGHLWSEKGGLTTEQQRSSVELREVDYERLLGSRGLGDPVTLEQIFDSLLSGQTNGLDPQALATLAALIRDTIKLELFARELARRVGGVDGAQVESVLHLLRTATQLQARDDDEPAAEAFANLATMLSGLSAETMADLLRRRGSPAAMVGERDAVQAVADRMAPEDLATFVSDSIAAEHGASHRLVEAFQALVPDLDERRQVVSLAERQAADSPFGHIDAFPDLWKQAEALLTPDSDEQFAHEQYAQYARELSFAKTQATEVEDISDDPEDRIASWLATVNDSALRSLDLQLVCDLLTLERDPHRWRDVADTACSYIEELTQAGDLEWALRLLDRVAREQPDGGTPTDDSLASFAAAVRDRLAAGPAVGHALARLHDGDDLAVSQVRRLCETLGAGIVTALAEALATERDARIRRTVRDILVGFGGRGRAAVNQLLDAPDWEVRQTAAFLLTEFSGNEGLDELGRLLTDPEPLVQREALRAVVNAGDEGAYQVLAGVLAKSRTGQRTALIQQLASQRDERAVPLCRYLLTHLDHRTSIDLYVATVETLGAVGGADAIEPLRDALYLGEWWAPFRTRALRVAAAQALRQTRRPAGEQVLRDAAGQGPRGVRAAARTQLAQIKARS